MTLSDMERVLRAKAAFSTRRIPLPDLGIELIDDRAPVAGDLVLARIDELGSHRLIELPSGRKASLFVGDEIVLAYGNRYAPDQYEAYVPTDLGPCHMVAAGGVAGRAECWHEKMVGPTAITPLGMVASRSPTGAPRPVNLADFALPIRLPSAAPGSTPPILAVFGTSMNAGKTTTAAGLVKGLTAAGLNVSALKITGTAAGGDLWLMRDAGAGETLDFTDAGYATTFGVPVADILRGAANLVATATANGCDAIVVEVADGLFQQETAGIAADAGFVGWLAGTVFAAGDAMGAVEGVAKLRGLGHHVVGASGAFTRSPLAIREAAQGGRLSVFTLADLWRPEIAAALLGGAAGRRDAVA